MVSKHEALLNAVAPFSVTRYCYYYAFQYLQNEYERERERKRKYEGENEANETKQIKRRNRTQSCITFF